MFFKIQLSHNLNSLKAGGIWTTVGVILADTRSLDCGSTGRALLRLYRILFAVGHYRNFRATAFLNVTETKIA